MLAPHPIRTEAPFSASRSKVSAGPQFQQFLKVASLNRQVEDQRIADGSAENAACRFHQRQTFRDSDLFRLLAGFHRQVHAILFSDLDNDVLAFCRLEARKFGFHNIHARNELRCVVCADFVCCERSCCAALGIGNRYNRASNDGSG